MMAGATCCHVIWDFFDLFIFEKFDKVFPNMTFAIFGLDPCPSQLLHGVGNGIIMGWIQEVVNIFVVEEDGADCQE